MVNIPTNNPEARFQKALFINHKHSQSLNNVLQKKNPNVRKFIQIKRQVKPIDQNKYKLLKVNPYPLYENYNTQIMKNTQETVGPIFYEEVIPSQTIIRRDNQYIRKIQPNYIYTPIKTSYNQNKNFAMFEEE
jgi:hypothetical protein